jgi:hypothetical protein
LKKIKKPLSKLKKKKKKTKEKHLLLDRIPFYQNNKKPANFKKLSIK